MSQTLLNKWNRDTIVLRSDAVGVGVGRRGLLLPCAARQSVAVGVRQMHAHQQVRGVSVQCV